MQVPDTVYPLSVINSHVADMTELSACINEAGLEKLLSLGDSFKVLKARSAIDTPSSRDACIFILQRLSPILFNVKLSGFNFMFEMAKIEAIAIDNEVERKVILGFINDLGARMNALIRSTPRGLWFNPSLFESLNALTRDLVELVDSFDEYFEDTNEQMDTNIENMMANGVMEIEEATV